MSNDDFKKLYWPASRAVLLGLIEEGTVPYLSVEGGYNQRLDIINDATPENLHAIGFVRKHVILSCLSAEGDGLAKS